MSLPRKRESSILCKYNKMDSCFRRNDIPFPVILFKNDNKLVKKAVICKRIRHFRIGGFSGLLVHPKAMIESQKKPA